MTRRQIPQRLRAGQLPAPAPAAAGHRPVMLALALAAGFTTVAARAQSVPIGAIYGTASFSQNGSNLVVTTTNGANGSHSAINWQSFNVPGGSTTYFNQPNAASTSINRVLGPDPSRIFGTLSSNGKLVLVNPNGIAVGAGAVVDTAGFTASTLRMSDADAIAGRLRFGDGMGGGGPLRVDGRVLARQGDVVLIGTDVQVGTGAVVESPAGATVLAAGQKVEVTGRGLEGIFFEVQAPTDQAVNLGTLRGDAVGIFAGTLRHSGLVQATGVTVEGGRVVLKATEHAETSGTTVAQGANGAGGQVDVLGRTVGVMAGATIDTSNTAGGGQIRVGGDYHGASAGAPNAQVTYVADGATLRANATDNGDGGRVIVWADDTTRVHGTIEARGGANGGDGGFVETSGKRVLQASGVKVDASAPKGKSGTWLLDPADITIVADGSEDATGAGSPDTVFSAGAPGSSVLFASTLDSALNAGGTNVTIETHSGTGGTGDITFDTSAGGMTFNKTTGGTTNLNLNADGAIRFAGGQSVEFQATDSAGTGVLNVNFNTLGNSVATIGGTSVTASTSGSGNAVNLNLTSGTTWQNDGNLYLNLNGTLKMDNATFVNTASGYVEINAGAAGGVAGGTGGTFQNQGYVAHNQGQFTVGNLANETGATFHAVDDAGPTDVKVTQSFSNQGTFNFYGHNLDLKQQSGNLDLTQGSFDVSASGSVKLEATAKDLLVGSLSAASIALTAGGSVVGDSEGSFTTYGSTGMNDPGVTINAGNSISFGQIDTRAYTNGQKVALTATNGSVSGGSIYTYGYSTGASGDVSVTSGSGGVHVGDVITRGGSLGASGGGVTLIANGTGGIDVGAIDTRGASSYSGQGGSGGAVVLSAGGGITVNDGISASGGSTSSGSLGGGGGGLVSLASTAGSLTVYGDVQSYGGDNNLGTGGNANGVSMSAAGDINVNGSIYVHGGGSSSSLGGAGGGMVSLTSTSGSVIVNGDIESYGGYNNGGAGGNGNSVSISAAGLARATYIDTSGSDSNYGQTGGSAGNISITGGTLALGYVGAYGGQGGGIYDDVTPGGTGGRGGNVTLVQTSGNLDLSAVTVAATGGDGGEGFIGGTGGHGGSISVVAQGGGVIMAPSSSSGGTLAAHGGFGGYGYDTKGGQGGDGGSINITAAAASQLLGTLAAFGGDGGTVDSGIGGDGGNGGSIAISAAGTLTLAGDVLAGAGRGGLAYGYDAFDNYVADPTRSGSNGSTWGTFQTAATGGIVVPSTTTRATPSPSGPPAFQAQGLVAAPPVAVPTQLYVDAQWTNNDSLTLQSGSTVLLGRADYDTGALQSSGQSLVNGPKGTIQGSGTIDGSVVNLGTVAPGSVGGIGRLVVTGDYTQGATGLLRMDVAANTPYVPGQTYDQLVVGGTANLGGQLVLASLPNVPTSTVAQATAQQMVMVSDSPTTFYELIQASASTGRFSLMSGPSAVMASMRMNIGGEVIDIPGGTAGGLVAALAQVLPGTSLSDLQQIVVETNNNSLLDTSSTKDDGKDKDKSKKGDEIVVTDTSCKPS